MPFWDMQKDKGISVDCGGMELNVCERVKEIDFLINVPVLKGHCQTKITCALKNMKGLIPNKEKRRFHSLGLHKPIAHLNMGIQQDFIVVDNICGDLDFEDGGNPVVMNRVMAACDPVLVDAYVCQMMHYEVAEVPYVKLAGELRYFQSRCQISGGWCGSEDADIQKGCGACGCRRGSGILQCLLRVSDPGIGDAEGRGAF